MVNLVKHPVSDAESAENIYLNRLIVFVEGMSDVEIFIRLFPDREDEIRFRTPSQETNGDGCIAVINRVAQERTDRSNPGRCIGIVDRDIYFSMKEWDILFEIDDEKYTLNSSQLHTIFLKLQILPINSFIKNIFCLSKVHLYRSMKCIVPFPVVGNDSIS